MKEAQRRSKDGDQSSSSDICCTALLDTGDKVSKLEQEASLLDASGEGESSSVVDAHRQRSSLESLLCYDKPIPEERIEEPVGLSIAEKDIGDNTRCIDCQAKGAVLCGSCSGSGLYMDSIFESQGIIVKVRFLV